MLVFINYWIEKCTVKHRNSWKSVQWDPSCSMRTNGRIDRHTDRHDEANSRFSQLCRPAYRQVWAHCFYRSAHTCAIIPCPAQSLSLKVRLPSGGNDSTVIDQTWRYEPLIAIRITPTAVSCSSAFLKLWSADHKWSSGSALVVLLDWTLVQKRQKK